ncbi:MAG: chemotaxis protein CheW [Gemmataceae bacterium]|nr:chemotaxis protein CheW [Gemmataceae bacterium]
MQSTSMSHGTGTDKKLPGPLEVLIFEVGGQHYGLVSSVVQELVRVVAITPLPQSSAMVEGVINLRGSTVPVVNVFTHLGLPTSSPTLSDVLVVVRMAEHRMALRVERVLELSRLTEIEEIGNALPGCNAPGWVARRTHGFVLILDFESLLTRFVGSAPSVGGER